MSEPDENLAATRLGDELRQLRIAAGYPTIGALAARIDGYGDSMLAKVETGRRVPGRQLFPPWLDACAVHIETRVPVLTGGHRRALTALWDVALKREGPVPEFAQKYFAEEAKACFVRLWALLLLPGLLQTRAYAHAMFLAEGLDEDEAAEKTGVRMGRQAILDGPDPAHATVVIHELALHFRVGSPEVMIGQLERLLELARRPNLVIQVVRDNGYFPGLRGPYELASGEAIPDTLLMLAVEDQMVQDGALTRKAVALFEAIRSYALKRRGLAGANRGGDREVEKPTAVNPGWRKSSHSDNGGASCVEVGVWRKSSHSDNGGATCVEVGTAATGVLVRDTTNRAGAVLTVPATAWRALLAEVRG